MFTLFNRKSEIDLLQKKYRKALKEYYELSKVNRSKSDSKYQEAQYLLDKIELLSKIQS